MQSADRREVGLPSARPVRYAGSRPSLRMRLANVEVALARVPGKTVMIGRYYVGERCTPAGPIPLPPGDAEVARQAALASAFHRRLAELGYQSPARHRFALEEDSDDELSLSAFITDLDVQSCTREDGRTPVRAATKLVVDWELFDPERQRVVYSGTTAGSHDGFAEPTPDPSGEYSLMAAFMRAGDRLLADAELVALLAPDSDVPAAPASESFEAPAARAEYSGSVPASSLSLRRGESRRSFREALPHLRAATATVHNGEWHGSGALIAPRFLLTNEHVVTGAGEVRVVLSGRELTARVVRHSRHRDVALLELDGDAGVDPLAIAAGTPALGTPIFLIGTPLHPAFHETLSRGSITSYRSIDGEPLYQTDASVNPGSSGGPAVDEHGELVGLVVSAFFENGVGMRVSYLIPIDGALRALAVEAP